MPHPLPPDLVQLLSHSRLLTMAQVSQVLGIPLYTCRDWGRRGLIPTVKIGRRVFVRATSFASWLKERENGG